MVLSRVAVLNAVVIGALATSGCTQAPVEEPRHLTEVDTARRARTPSPSNTLFGVDLNKPTDLPPCDAFETEPRPSCTTQEGIELQASEVAEVMERPTLSVRWDTQGRVQSVSALTQPATAEATLSLMISKFGLPDYQDAAVLPRYRNTWRWTYQDAVVGYMNVESFVMVSLTTAEQARRDQAKAAQALEEEIKRSEQKRTL